MVSRSRLDRASKEAKQWNDAHPVGTSVVYQKVRGGEYFSTTTRSEAYVATSGDAVVFLTGVSGFYLLSFVQPAEVRGG